MPGSAGWCRWPAPALLRAIELNGVGGGQQQAGVLAGPAGRRRSAGDRRRCCTSPAEAPADRNARRAGASRGVQHLTGYQDRAYARRFADFVARVRVREASLGADPSLPFTRAVARSLLKLMAYKDEYEVARLYTDGEFLRTLRQQFEGDHGSWSSTWRRRSSAARRTARRRARSAWAAGCCHAMKLLAQGRPPARHGVDVFGYTEERRLERSLIASTGGASKRCCRRCHAGLKLRGRRHRGLAAVHARLRPRQARRTWRWRGCAKRNCCTASTRHLPAPAPLARRCRRGRWPPAAGRPGGLRCSRACSRLAGAGWRRARSRRRGGRRRGVRWGSWWAPGLRAPWCAGRRAGSMTSEVRRARRSPLRHALLDRRG
jgi:hypothetical protein